MLTLVLALLSGASAQVTPEAAYQLGKDAYIFGYPLVLMGETAFGANRFTHRREFPDYTFRGVVRPNADTLYSSSFADLSAGPLVLTVPDTNGRYYVVQAMDAWTNTFAAPGSRTTGNGAGWFLFAGPDWKGSAPAGVTVYRSVTNLIWILGRIQTNTAADYGFVHKLQDGFTLTPLSGGVPAAEPARAMPQPRMQEGPMVRVEKMDAATFFGALCRLMKQNPPAPADGPFVARLAQIGIMPGRDFDFAALDVATQQALERAVRDVPPTLGRNALESGRRSNGWNVNLKIGAYGTDYALRARVARVGLGANLPEDAIYPSTSVDAEGQALNGSHRYVLHFAKVQLPPVKAFWSLTVYDARGFFIENPINRYAIGDRDKLKFNADGSLDLYIQAVRPAEGEANWLPAPKEAFNLSLRLYWPKDEALQGKWMPPAVKRVD